MEQSCGNGLGKKMDGVRHWMDNFSFCSAK